MNIKIAQTIRIPTKSQILLTKYPIKIESESPIKIESESESPIKIEVPIKRSEENISYIKHNDPTIESTIPIKPITFPIELKSESPIKIESESESESPVKKEVLIKKSEQNISYINRNDPTIESTIPIKPVIFPIKLKSESPVEMIESIIQKDPTIESSISKKLSEFKSKIHEDFNVRMKKKIWTTVWKDVININPDKHNIIYELASININNLEWFKTHNILNEYNKRKERLKSLIYKDKYTLIFSNIDNIVMKLEEKIFYLKDKLDIDLNNIDELYQLINK